MEFVNTISYHRKHPDISLSDYYCSLRLELATSISTKKKVYLDTNFWVLLRNGAMNPSSCNQEYYMLQLALKLVESGVCIFPISEDVFLEVIRQTDEKTLLNTVQLIDLLSQGVSTLSYQERVQFELMYFLHSHSNQKKHLPQEMIWTKLSYTMGFNSFTYTAIPDFDNLTIQKAFTDQMWSISLREQIEMMLSNGVLKNLPELPTAENINQGKFSHSHEASIFKHMFMNEVAGWIDVNSDLLCELMEHTYSQTAGRSVSESIANEDLEKATQEMKTMVYNIFRLNKMGLYLPSAHIISGLYAAVRWDKEQRFQDHDFHDFRHASAALPYFDYFFTEKRLTHLVTQNLLKFDKLFKCQVYSKVSQAIKALESLS